VLLIGGEEIEDGSDVVGEGEAGERSLTLRLKKPASWLLTLVDATALIPADDVEEDADDVADDDDE